jgi:hypothetical protein
LLRLLALAAAFLVATSLTGHASAHAPSGAIFTTLADGSEVNLNQFPDKESVYLDGGPGPGAPQDAAGLDDGTYVFQVTDPSGKTLLSTDLARCRQFIASGGVITAVVDNDCEHVTGNDIDHPPAKTVQLVPFSLTPNPGGVFKVWVTRVEDFLLGCQDLGHAGNTGLDIVDCGEKDGDNAHGFIPAHSKTDNFKIKDPGVNVEIDAIFYRDLDGDGAFDWDSTETQVSGLHMIWQDTVGAKNKKHSYFLKQWGLTEAHAEALEPGTHHITIPDLSAQGCEVGDIYINDVNHYLAKGGPQTVKVDVSKPPKGAKTMAIQLWVACQP